MLIYQHVIVGVIAAAILYPVFGLAGVLTIFAVSVLLDVDHYLIYIYRYRDFDLKRAYNFFRQVEDGGEFYPALHMVEIAVLGAFISNQYPVLLPFVIGQALHITQDWFEDMFLRTTRRNFFGVKLLYE